MNKLSELSKPVQIFKHPFGRNFWSVSADSNAGVQGVEPYYSQEYVSALLAELEEKVQHNTLLQGEINNGKKLRVNLQNSIDSLNKRIAELLQKLATPVLLPEPDDLEPNTEPCVICGMVSSHPDGWHYCHPKNIGGNE